ncbi:MAG: phosphatase PAP2 family protein [Oscillospiraceae bacterium]|nr:phosphatase PAP2 family protein [Oscillospiraceae bacterium]
MKKALVDYRQFRLRKINQPEYSHLKLLLGWLGYFTLYFLTENLIPIEKCRPVHCAVDDLIPFCEYFVIPYVLWYGLIVFSLGYFLLYNIDAFKKLQTYIIITQIVAMIIYIAFPNRQDLRPEFFPRDNFCTDIIALLYAFDTSTGVCPSLHCAYSIGIASVWLKEKDENVWLRAFIALFCLIICISTMFIKQHSFVDFIAAIPVCILAEYLVFHKIYPKDKLK